MQRRKLLAVMGPMLFGLSRFRTGMSAGSTDASSLSTSPTLETKLSSGSTPALIGGSGSMPTTYLNMAIGSQRYWIPSPLNVSVFGFPTVTPPSAMVKPPQPYFTANVSLEEASGGSGGTGFTK